MTENNSTQTVGETPEDSILTISRPAAHYLHETSKWTNFLSIMGFILTGLIVVAALFVGSIMSLMRPGEMNNMPKGTTFFLSIMYMIMGLLYFFPSWYLFKYTQKLKSALSSRDSNELIAAFENQKSLYKFWGIFTISIISFYAIILVVTLLIASFR